MPTVEARICGAVFGAGAEDCYFLMFPYIWKEGKEVFGVPFHKSSDLIHKSSVLMT